MLCSSKAAHSRLATIRTYSDDFTKNRSSHYGVSTDFQDVNLGFAPRSEFSSRWNLKSKSRNARLKLVKIFSMDSSEFEFTHAVDTNPQAQELILT